MNRPPANTGQRNGSFNGIAPSRYFIAYASENVKAFRPASTEKLPFEYV